MNGRDSREIVCCEVFRFLRIRSSVQRKEFNLTEDVFYADYGEGLQLPRDRVTVQFMGT